jgi:hypothetical protein
MMKIYPDDGRPKKWPEITRRTCSHFKVKRYCLNGVCKKTASKECRRKREGEEEKMEANVNKKGECFLN